MSVLKSLRGTLQSVQQSFKRLSSTEKPIEVDSDTVNKHAGADILNRFQQHWMEIHKNSEDNAKKAEEIDSQISSLYLSCDRKADGLNTLNEELVYIPELIQHLENITTSIALINSQCEDTEKMLTDLENLVEEQDMVVNKNSHHSQLSVYSERKQAELKQLRVQMAQQHAQRVQEYEEKKQAQLQERQQAFEEAFALDLEHYKLYGSSPRQPSVSSNELDVGEIKIDDDEVALDNFLESTEKETEDQSLQETQDVFEFEEDDSSVPAVTVATDEDIDTGVAQELKNEAQIVDEEETTDSEVDKETDKDISS